MPPGGRVEGAKNGRTKQEQSPAAGRRRGEDIPPLPSPTFPASQRTKEQRRKKREQQEAAASLPEGPLMEILSRVPYRSLCRFKCVSRSWLALCSNPDIRRRSPQTLSGFFHNHRYGRDLRFRNLSGRGAPMVDPALPFLRGYAGFKVEQCCGGLLLCKCWKSHAQEKDLVVCNPATEKWTVVPPIVFLDDATGAIPAEVQCRNSSP
nr:F-box protein At5g07610-like [Lolium perenne]